MLKQKDVMRTGTYRNHHYIVFRTDPHWFKTEVYNAQGCSRGITQYRYTVKDAWADAIEYIALYLAKEK